MKSRFSRTWPLFLLFFVAVAATSCKKDKNTDQELTIKVASKLDLAGAAPPASANNPSPIYYMNITNEATNEKFELALGRIEGFDYVEGYEYELKVLKSLIKNPPADGHIDRYKLLEVISKSSR